MLAILTTHPIQYQVPLWQALHKAGVPMEVWYLTAHGTGVSFDVQFGQSFAWDIATLEGYPHRFMEVNEQAAPARGFRGIRLKTSLIPLLKERKVRALFINGWQVQAYWQAAWQAHMAGVEVWLRAETNDIKPIQPWKEPVRSLLLQQLFKRISRFLYIGESNKRFYLSRGIRNDQLAPGPYCVDNDRFAAAANAVRASRSEIRQQWGIPDGAYCFLFSGKFINKKRPLDLVQAAAQWKGLQPVHLLFVGSGELDPTLRAACRVLYPLHEPGNANTGPTASFTGFLNQQQIAQAYVAADALVLPSDFGETWGLVVNEAMATGLPALVSDQVGCAEDLVAPLNPALVFRCGDVASLHQAMVQMVSNPPSPNQVQSQVDHYHLRVTVRTLQDLYTNLGPC